MSNKNLIIVESPSKIKTLKKFLGNEYQIEASVGHIRDLPKKNLGIDLENNFTAKYEVSDKSKKVVKNLKNVLKSVDTIYIATDPDREGEAIAWHLIDELKPKIPVKRMVFNEITKGAILESLKNILSKFSRSTRVASTKFSISFCTPQYFYLLSCPK